MFPVYFGKDRDRFDWDYLKDSTELCLNIRDKPNYEILEFKDGEIGIAFYIPGLYATNVEDDDKWSRKRDIVAYYRIGDINSERIVTLTNKILDLNDYVDRMLNVIQKFHVVNMYGDDYLPILMSAIQHYLNRWHYELPVFYIQELVDIFKKEMKKLYSRKKY